MKVCDVLSGLVVGGAVMGASGESLLWIDLTVENQITIEATGGASLVDATASNFTGIYLDGFFGGSGSVMTSSVSGDLVSANEVSDGSPELFRAGGGTDGGLNIWSMVAGGGDMTFESGMVAFSGSSTWGLDASTYALIVSGLPSSGDVYANADDSGDIGNGAVLIGGWGIPTPGSLVVLGFGGLVGVRRRR